MPTLGVMNTHMHHQQVIVCVYTYAEHRIDALCVFHTNTGKFGQADT